MWYTKFRIALLTCRWFATSLNTMAAPAVQLHVQALVVYKVYLNLLHMYDKLICVERLVK